MKASLITGGLPGLVHVDEIYRLTYERTAARNRAYFQRHPGDERTVRELCAHVLEKYPQASWWLHFHNTRGMAMANIIAAMDAGMTRFDSAFGGLGGCPFVPGAAGNISSEDVIHMCDESGIETGVDVTKVMAVSRSLRELLGHDMESYILRAGRSCDLIEKNAE